MGGGEGWEGGSVPDSELMGFQNETRSDDGMAGSGSMAVHAIIKHQWMEMLLSILV